MDSEHDGARRQADPDSNDTKTMAIPAAAADQSAVATPPANYAVHRSGISYSARFARTNPLPAR